MDVFHAQWTFSLAPFGCRNCAVPQDRHGWRYTAGVGGHHWVKPTERQIKNRMQVRRRHMGAYRWR